MLLVPVDPMLFVVPPNELVGAPNPELAPKPAGAEEPKPPDEEPNPAEGAPNAELPLDDVFVALLSPNVLPCGNSDIVGSDANTSWWSSFLAIALSVDPDLCANIVCGIFNFHLVYL
jgi:hypothetical protein